MNIYVGIAYGLAGLFALCSVVSWGVAIAAYLDLVRVDAVIAFVVAISFAGYALAPLGYARDVSR